MEQDTLNILWTNADPGTSINMVMLYAKNSILKGWWKNVTVCVWGSTAKYLANDAEIQKHFDMAKEIGVRFTGCITCAQNEGVADKLTEMGVELHGWGPDLTALLKSRAPLLCI